MDNEITCPYCGHKNHHDTECGHDEDRLYHTDCSACDMVFTYTISISYSYTELRADCLNGGEHKWKLAHTSPKFLTKFCCEWCGEERKPTNAEREEHKLYLTAEEKVMWNITPEMEPMLYNVLTSEIKINEAND